MPVHFSASIFRWKAAIRFCFWEAQNGSILIGVHNRFVSLSGTNIFEYSEEAKTDIAIINLDKAATIRLSWCDFIGATQIAGDEYQGPQSNYLAVGYFQNRNRPDPAGKTHNTDYGAFTVIKKQTFSNKLVFHFDVNDFYSGFKKIQTVPLPIGLSGGPVFCFGP